MSRRHILLTGILLVTACAGTDDPRQGGLLGGVQGLSTGAYEKRIQQRQESLQRLKEIQGELDAEREELARKKSEEQAEIRRLENRLGRLNRDVARLRRDLKARHGAGERDGAARASIERDLASLQHDIADVEQKASQGGLSVAELEAQRNRMESDYRQLLDLYFGLGK